MPNSRDGSGSIYKRGNVWWVKVYVGGKARRESSKSEKLEDAKRLRDKLLGQKHRGEISGGSADKVTVSELLDDLLEYGSSNIRASTAYIWKLVIEKNLRPFFGTLRAQKVTTEKLKEYRRKRLAEGRSDATANRELSILRTAFHNGRKCTPPKVTSVPFFPMTPETNVRTGFLTDEQYASVLRELPPELKPLFAVGYATGIRLGELKSIKWDQVDFNEGLITLATGETKNGEARAVPILEGEMQDLLTQAKAERDTTHPDCGWVFSRNGEPIRDFRWSWRKACERAGVPDLNFHDLRRTAVRNMRRYGVPQVVRMRISGHKTDSMERRYNIVDGEDIKIAKSLMQAGRKRASD